MRLVAKKTKKGEKGNVAQKEGEKREEGERGGWAKIKIKRKERGGGKKREGHLYTVL